MKVLLLDNYDSFTYNLAHLINWKKNIKLSVIKNDAISINDINFFDKIILSPGAGLPKDAGIMPELLKNYSNKKSILGICLGMQAIAEQFNASLLNLNTVFHGLATKIYTDTQNPLFKNCPNNFNVGRYHSWVVNPKNFPDALTVSASDEQKNIMAISHKMLNIHGVQFHPESILSEYGQQIINNWLEL
ncbi:MAG: aminodeoxychorismate/anthranilate synthase component II [Bacteroidetes bacterium]|nr:aminodeoxychorismate/anthranilate synthase component II [Bacteroidota bacterium]